MALQSSSTPTTTKAGNSSTLEQLPVPADLAAKITKQCPSWTAAKLTGATYTRDRNSDFPACRAELSIYDSTGRRVVSGREFSSSQIFFWD